MVRKPPKHKSKREEPKKAPSRFAPAAFLSANPESVQSLCEDLALQIATRFSDLTGTTWEAVGYSIIEQLRASGHDLSQFDESEGLQEWQAVWHHPRGSFSLFLSFRTPASVEVTWKSDDRSFVAHA